MQMMVVLYCRLRYNQIKGDLTMLEFKYDTQLLVEGEQLSEDSIGAYITNHIEGDCLLAVGDEDLIKVHFHTNTPWKVIEYCASLGEVYDVVIENMERQEQGLKG
jgi:dihydroxyacetone kinase-like predicted kinase